MATTYYGLTWWQWGIVVLWAIANGASVASGSAEFAGAVVGSGIVLYLIARLVATASRSVRRKTGIWAPAEN